MSTTASAGSPATDPQAGAPGAGAAPPAGSGQPAGGGAAGADLAALQKENEALKTRVTESERAAEYWHGKATAPGEKKPAAPAADPEPEVDVLELATKGGKEFEKFLTGWAKKNGFVSADEVRNTVNSKASEMVKEQELVGRYPDLKDRDSDFFKATAAAYGVLKEQGVPEAQAMEIAAERTELSFMRSGKIKTSQQKTEDEKAEREKQRLARIAAQGGDRGGGRTPEPEEGDEEITPAEEKIIRGMLVGQPGKDGKPMNFDQAVEAFKARAKNGVHVSRRTR
jgi:hypothetical protein